MENKIKHLEMIQGIINRMANNSFLIKGWTVALIVGIFTLSNIKKEGFYSAISGIPLLAFWGIDAYYLYQERLYRFLYDRVRQLEEDKIDFSMKLTSQDLGGTTYIKTLFSITEILFYVPLLSICALICMIIIG